MGLEKSEVRLAALHEMGVRLDDLLDAAKREVAEANGAKTAAAVIAQRLAEKTQALDRAFIDGQLSITKETYDGLKRAWADATRIASEVALSSGEQFFRCQGKVSALEASVKVTKGLHDATQAKVDAVKRGDLVAEDSGQLPGPVPGDAKVLPIRRQEGVHPGNPIAALRARGEGPEKAPARPQDELKDPGLGLEPPKPRGSKKPVRKPRKDV